MRKAEKRKIGEQRQALNRQESIASGQKALNRDRERRLKKQKEQALEAQKTKAKENAKKAGEALKDMAKAASKAGEQVTENMRSFNDAMSR